MNNEQVNENSQVYLEGKDLEGNPVVLPLVEILHVEEEDDYDGWFTPKSKLNKNKKGMNSLV